MSRMHEQEFITIMKIQRSDQNPKFNWNSIYKYGMLILIVILIFGNLFLVRPLSYLNIMVAVMLLLGHLSYSFFKTGKVGFDMKVINVIWIILSIAYLTHFACH